MECDELIKEFIKYNILNNAYYESIKDMYDVSDNKDCFIQDILNSFDEFGGYYSIYTIMDSIVLFIETHTDVYKIEQIVYSPDFEIKDY